MKLKKRKKQELVAMQMKSKKTSKLAVNVR